MLYLIVFCLASILLLISVITKKNMKVVFVIFFTFITILSMFRYGSGTDFFGYSYHFLKNPDNILDAIYMQPDLEIGYRVWMTIIKSLGMNFDSLIFFSAFGTMALFFITIIKHSNFKLLSFILFFAIYYNAYINSGIRQGIALGIIFYSFYKYFKREQYNKFFIAIIISSLFHISSLVVVAFIPIYLLSKKTFNNFSFNLIIICLSGLFYLLDISSSLVVFANYIGIYIPYEKSDTNLLAIILRVIFLIYVFIIHRYNEKTSEFEKGQIYIYFIGTLVYFSISNIQIFSRLLEYFTILEIIFIPNFIHKIKLYKDRSLLAISIIIISGTILVKDLNSFTNQQDYYNKGAINYKYTTIFNKNSIYEYKNKNRLEEIIN